MNRERDEHEQRENLLLISLKNPVGKYMNLDAV
jgi:hypothetical protein